MITFFRKIRIQLMEQKKVSKYLLYAVGEILLVVIGILIAVGINDWNEGKKNHQKVRNNTILLIENLVLDSINIVETNGYVEMDRNRLNDFERRINGPNASIDTLIKIASNEYKPGVSAIRFENSNAYNTMVMSGEINLFEKDLLEEIYGLYTLQERTNLRANDSFETYINRLNNYNSRYFFDNSNNLVIEGALYEKLWSNIDEKDFIAKFNSMASGIRLIYNQQQGYTDRTSVAINELLPKLRQLLAND